MGYALLVYEGHTLKDLLHEYFDGLDVDTCFALFRLLNYFLQIFVAVFENQILCGFTVLALRVVDLKHLHYIFALLELV